MTKVIYNCEGTAIGETVDGKVNWYYSDGKFGGERGGHYMSTYEFLSYNHLL